MGSLFKSEDMKLVEILERNDAARDIVRVLGEVGAMELKDLNSGTNFFRRTFSDELKRCEEMSRVLDFLGKQLTSDGIVPARRDESAALMNVAVLSSKLDELQTDVRQMKMQELQVLFSLNALKEHLQVLQLGSSVFGGSTLDVGQPSMMEEGGPESSVSVPLIPNGVGARGDISDRAAGMDEGMLRIVAGTVPRESALAFEKIIYRMARGNCVVHSLPIDAPLLARDSPREPVYVPKNVILVFFSGSVLGTKLAKLTSSFGFSLFDFSADAAIRAAKADGLIAEIGEMTSVTQLARNEIRNQLESIRKEWFYWRHVVEIEKATLNALNLLSFDIKRRSVFKVEGWVPVSKVAALRTALDEATKQAGRATQTIMKIVETSETPPTYLPVNKFTAAFQGLVDTYGIPRYREVNPGCFAIVWFPFLFAIMFGDIGHGSLLLMLALYLIRNEAKMSKMELDDIVGMIFGGRYILLMNALFAIYVGFLYNEMFAVPLGLFTSGWRGYPGIPDQGPTYPFGVDPAWHLAANKMTFFNSYKMKVAIVFGVIQMTIGITLQLVNHITFKDARSIWFGLVPELVFFLSIFGYLVVMILTKWSIDWVGLELRPPSLLNTLIDMFMAPGKYNPTADRLFSGQENLQVGLLLIALVAVPFLLIPKPLLHFLDMRRRYQTLRQLPDTQAGLDMPMARAEEGGEEEEGDEEEGDEEHDIGEVVVHQVIHTIEFVLGSISNTASYLRLWALSLAHSQLSELFWGKVMVEQALTSSLPFPFNAIILFLGFTVWFVLHLCVIMVMENLSSFLHALRLQWVEFQNKFYHGDGRKFSPFSFSRIYEGKED